MTSLESGFSSVAALKAIDKKKCLMILQQIIAVKREQAFCQSADKEIFQTEEMRNENPRSAFTESNTSES